MMKTPLAIRIIHLDGCLATPPTLENIRLAAKDLGVPVDLEMVAVDGHETAENFRHIGSPTVQIYDLDIEPAARSVEAFGLT